MKNKVHRCTRFVLAALIISVLVACGGGGNGGSDTPPPPPTGMNPTPPTDPNPPTNATPELASIGNQTVEESQPLSFTVTATDDGDAPTLSISALPTGATFDPSSGAFSWTPPAGAAADSPYSVTVTATDTADTSLADSETITVTVTAVSADCTTAITSPSQGYLQARPDLAVAATLSCVDGIPDGWGVKVSLVGTAADDTERDSGSINTVLTFPAQADYTLRAVVVDASDAEQSGTEVTVAPVGFGDYYVAIGDSITLGVGGGAAITSGDERNTSNGYTARLNNLLTAARVYPHTVVNAGQLSETSGGGASRISNVLSANSEANFVLVMYGMNDARPSLPVPPSGGPGSFKANMQQIIDEIVAVGMTPVLAKVNIALSNSADDDPAVYYPDPDQGARSENIKAFNDVVDELVAENPSITTVAPDFYNLFLTAMRYDTEYDDAIHPNATGYQSMAELWSQQLTQ